MKAATESKACNDTSQAVHNMPHAQEIKHKMHCLTPCLAHSESSWQWCHRRGSEILQPGSDTQDDPWSAGSSAG